MPDFVSRNEASTSWVLLPIEDTIPIPVTTTRLMSQSSSPRGSRCRGAKRFRSCTGGSGFAHLEEPDPQVLGRIDRVAVGFKPAVPGAKGEFSPDHPLQLDNIFELAHGRQHHAGEFDFADTQRTALARSAEPTQEKAKQLPQRVEPKASRHNRIAFEMAGEKPEVRLHVELGHDAAI